MGENIDDPNATSVRTEDLGTSSIGLRRSTRPDYGPAFIADLDDDGVDEHAAKPDVTEYQSIDLYHAVWKDMKEESHFFDQNAPRSNIPTFHKTEMHLGDMLGQGEFGSVYEVLNFGFKTIKTVATKDTFSTQTGSDDKDVTATAATSTEELQSTTATSQGDELRSSKQKLKMERPINEEEEEEYSDLLEIMSSDGESEVSDLETDGVVAATNSPTSKKTTNNLNQEFEKDQVKAAMIRRPMRGDKARYAVKVARLADKPLAQKADAIVDLACEALFLSRIVHPNIIKLRATVGDPGSPAFMIVLDRLSGTVANKIEKDWKERFKKGKVGLLSRVVPGKRDRKAASLELFLERLLVVYDIARALRYLHNHKLLFRDLKPENVGIDSRGQVRLFDFGLCKELKPSDLVERPDMYQATGCTGSRRFMAPEVVRCLPYGFSADVYSLSILFWMIFALDTPFATYTAAKHMDKVVIGGNRPPAILNNLYNNKRLQLLMEDCWSSQPGRRPRIDAFCSVLQSELAIYAGAGKDGGDLSFSNRSENLMNMSVHSIRRIMADK